MSAERHAFTRLTIEPRSDAPSPLLPNHLTFKLDDYELHHIDGVRVIFEKDSINRVELVLAVGEVHVDAEVLPMLELLAREQDDQPLVPPPPPEGPQREGA